MAINLFNRTETILRTTGVGDYDEDENYIAGTTTSMSIKCNIQPYREGTESSNSPTGYSSRDVIKVYTPDTLQAVDEDAKIVGDQLTYKGRQYFCKDLEQWDEQDVNGLSLIPVHNIGYFHRKDKA